LDIQHETERVQPNRRNLERAWAAGFFDGEGCTFYRAYRDHYSVEVSISQVNPRTLNRFHEVVRIGKPQEGKMRPSRTIWKLRVYGWDKCITFLKPIWPFLSDEKRTQALKALMQYAFRPLGKPPNNMRKGWHAGAPKKSRFELGIGIRQYVPPPIQYSLKEL
jgi:hypothetical protein